MMNLRCIILLLTLSLTLLAHAEETIKIYILAGQSNMEGKAHNKLLKYQATDPKTKALFSHLRKDNQWITRDDVFIKFLNRHGKLTIGYGSPDRTGPELEFGTVIGNHHKAPVLLIKTAWGGHSLYQKFRSPSAGLPAPNLLEEELKKAIAHTQSNNEKRKRNDPLPTMETIKAAYGSSYRMMLQEIQTTLTNYESLFPELKGKTPELTGFVWFQGWNDQYNGAEKQYASNMQHFIEDVRKDLRSPKLPFVIGIMGQNGSTPAKGPMKIIQDAQKSMEAIPKLKGNVAAIPTDTLVDKTAEKLAPTAKTNPEQWQKVGSNGGYHYYGSPIWFNRIGKSLANAMLTLETTNP